MAVYFAQSGAYVKIGYSKDPIARSCSITRLGTRPADVPFDAEVDLIGWVPGDRWRETELHGRFTADRVAGEWFYITRETAADLIWEDPRGVDFKRMSAMAVFAADKYPHMTRDEIEAAGITVEGRSLADVFADPDSTVNTFGRPRAVSA